MQAKCAPSRCDKHRCAESQLDNAEEREEARHRQEKRKETETSRARCRDRREFRSHAHRSRKHARGNHGRTWIRMACTSHEKTCKSCCRAHYVRPHVHTPPFQRPPRAPPRSAWSLVRAPIRRPTDFSTDSSILPGATLFQSMYFQREKDATRLKDHRLKHD